MTAFLTAAACIVLGATGLALIRLLRGPSVSDRMMAVQLAGTGLGATCLLLAAVSGADAIVDVAVTLALLAAVAAAALSLDGGRAKGREP